jgi:hypothetical protein
MASTEQQAQAALASALLPFLLREQETFEAHDDVAYIAKGAGNRVECGELYTTLSPVYLI